MDMPDVPPDRTTNKLLGPWMCLTLVVGNMIGSGVFLLPASLAPLGWNAVFGWIVTILGGMALAWVFASLAGAVPAAGGPYAYTRAAFGPAAAFVVAWSYWVSLWIGNAAIAVAGVSYLGMFAPELMARPGMPVILTALSLWTLTGVNCWGVRAAGGVQLVTTLLKLLPLVAVILLGALLLWRGGSGALLPFQADSISAGAIGAATTLTLWGLLGLESATVPATKVENPGRNIPRATLVGTALTGLIYLLACSAVTLLSDPIATARSDAPIADFVAASLGPGAGIAVALFAAISAFGALNGWILLQGEMPWAMASDGVFPRWLARLSRRGTPVRAHLLSSVLATLVLLSNYSSTAGEFFTFAVLLATTAVLVAYATCAAALLRLAAEGRMKAGAGLCLVTLLAGFYALWAIAGAGRSAILWGLLLLVIGLPVHLAMRRLAPEQVPE
jgi:APA family basic amino acid/polyamine antiporter